MVKLLMTRVCRYRSKAFGDKCSCSACKTIDNESRCRHQSKIVDDKCRCW